MYILFATIAFPESLETRNIYTDLMEELRDRGHSVFVVASCERRNGKETHISVERGIRILRVRTWNIKKTRNIFEKGFGTLLVERQFRKALDAFFGGVKFDLVLTSTPPITLDGLVRYVKQRDGARSYLLLKDIFPQNAVDLGMIKKGGLLHRYFRMREKRLYRQADYIGCMSPANADFIAAHNSGLPGGKIEVCPNSIRPTDQKAPFNRAEILRRYSIPEDAAVFSYGGNLGKPQGVTFLKTVLQHHRGRKDVFFFIVGSGTEYPGLRSFLDTLSPGNALLHPFLPKEEYRMLLKASDVGMIFLDPRFTIPNFPSRLLDCMDLGKPILAATDTNTDIGTVITKGGFGLWCESGDLQTFSAHVDKLVSDRTLRERMGKTARQYLLDNYTASKSADIILRHFDEGRAQNVS
jgi:glycosyltransferase involved in cell wall biosynthesis